MNHDIEFIKKAYPLRIEKDVTEVLGRINVNTEIIFLRPFSVLVKGERLEIPYRIGLDEENLNLKPSFNSTQADILDSLYSRHFDGHVREKCVRNIITSKNIWVVPFVIQLVGEYVLEILQVIKSHLGEIDGDSYREFLHENPCFYETNKRRVMSYWNCYYRNQYWQRDQYAGFQIIEYFNHLLKKQ